MEISSISGVPAHPLFVHLPVVGIPLVAVLFLAYVLLPSKRSGLFWPTAVSIAFVTVATIVAASTGESLEEQLSPEQRNSSLLHTHTELGEQTRTIMIFFAIAALGFLAYDWWKARQSGEPIGTSADSASASSSPSLSKAIVALGLVGILLGGVATVWDVRTGHAGAKSTWSDTTGTTTYGDDDD